MKTQNQSSGQCPGSEARVGDERKMKTCICPQKTGNTDKFTKATVVSKHEFRNFRANKVKTKIGFITFKLTEAKEIDPACGMEEKRQKNFKVFKM